MIKLRYPRFRYAIVGEVTEIYITRRDGSNYTVYIDTKNLLRLDGWSMSIKKHGKGFCARISKGGEVEQLLHRFLCPDLNKPFVDHKDNNALNNVEANLRPSTNAENQQNRQGSASNSCSGIRGVSFDAKNNKWRADVGLNNKLNYLGLYQSIEEAEEVVKAFRAKNMLFSKEAINGNTEA